MCSNVYDMPTITSVGASNYKSLAVKPVSNSQNLEQFLKLEGARMKSSLGTTKVIFSIFYFSINTYCF